MAQVVDYMSNTEWNKMSIIWRGLDILESMKREVPHQFVLSVMLSITIVRKNPNFCFFFLIATTHCIRHRAVISLHLLPRGDISAVQSSHCWIPTWSCTPRPDFGRRWRPSASFLSVFNKTGDCPSSLRACRVHVSPYKTPSPSTPITDPLRDTNLTCNLWNLHTTLRAIFGQHLVSRLSGTAFLIATRRNSCWLHFLLKDRSEKLKSARMSDHLTPTCKYLISVNHIAQPFILLLC